MATKITQITAASDGWAVNLTHDGKTRKFAIAGWALAEYQSDRRVVPMIAVGGELVLTSDIKETTISIIEPRDPQEVKTEKLIKMKAGASS